MAARRRPWQQYQQDAADLLTELGFTTQVEDRVTSARGVTHEVDVSARRAVAGVDVLWVVECKLWRSRIGKEKVAALAAICADLGADRGLLLSEIGFQSGALKMAAGRNITLTSLEDLRATVARDLLHARQQQADHRLRRVEVALRQINTPHERGHELLKFYYLVGLSENERARRAEESDPRVTDSDFLDIQRTFINDFPRALKRMGTDRRIPEVRALIAAETAEIAVLIEAADRYRKSLNDGVFGQWPVLMADEGEVLRTTWGMRQLLDLLEPLLERLENQIASKQVGSVQNGYTYDTTNRVFTDTDRR